MNGLQNVQIPMPLFEAIMSFFYYLELSNHQFPSIFDVHGMCSELTVKQESINLRKAYSNIIYAKGDEQKRSARADYLKLKEKKATNDLSYGRAEN